MAVTDGLCRSFLDLWEHFDPAAASLAGPGGHDARLGAFDAEAVRTHAAALRSIAGAVEELDVADTADEIDRTALLDHVRVQLFRVEREHPWRSNPALWVEHALVGLDALLLRGPGAEAALASRLADLPRFLRDCRETLRTPPRFHVETAMDELDGLAVLVEEVGARMSAAGLEQAAPVTEAEEAIERLRLALRADIAPDPAPPAIAIGEDEVDRRLHFEQASVHNASEVWRGALRLAAEIEQEVIAQAALIDATRPWREVYERIAPLAGSPEALLGTALQSAARFAVSAGLSPREMPGPALAPMPRWARLIEPAAVYLPAGGEHQGLIRSTASGPVVPWLAARLGVPGAHAAAVIRAGLPGLVRREIGASGTLAGWPLYAAELLRDAGWENDPEPRLAERVLALVDAHLAVLDLGIHARQMPPDEAIGHLTARLPLDRAAALAHVRRIASNPTSACAAHLGRRELHRLRDDARTARGGAFSLREHHEEVLSYGALPVPLIRWGMGLDG